jgi:hypothetical protein
MKKPKAPRLVTVAIFTTVTIIFWIFMGLYNIITSPSRVDVDPEILKPINPVLDTDALNRLQNRVFFEEGETSSPIIVSETPVEESAVEETFLQVEEVEEENVSEPETITPTEEQT